MTDLLLIVVLVAVLTPVARRWLLIEQFPRIWVKLVADTTRFADELGKLSGAFSNAQTGYSVMIERADRRARLYIPRARVEEVRR